jgi:hypothetical protein
MPSLVIVNLGAGTAGDLAIGVPRDSTAVFQAGWVNVLYGTASGLTTANAQLWTQNSAGVVGAAQSHDEFGQAVS